MSIQSWSLMVILAAVWLGVATGAAAQPIEVAVFQDPGVSPADAGGHVVNQLNNSTLFSFHAQYVELPADLLANLSSYDAVVIGNDGYHEDIDELRAVASELKAWVEAGGTLVATGWMSYDLAFGSPFNPHPDLLAIMPIIPSQILDSTTTLTITSATGIATGVSTFNYGNWLNWGTPRPGATVLGIAGASGKGAIVTWQVGLGTVTYLAPIYMGSRSTYGATLDLLRCCDPDRLLEQAVANAPAPIASDTTAPVITAPASVTVNSTSGAGAVVTYSASATDNSGVVASFVCSPPSGSTFPIGDTLVTCTAIDGSGNTATKSFNVHVNSAADQFTNLIATINTSTLPNGTKTALLDGFTGSCTSLNVFINKVQAQSQPPAGKPIPTSLANQLIAAALQIKTVLGCP